jgi:hypothetical protein
MRTEMRVTIEAMIEVRVRIRAMMRIEVPAVWSPTARDRMKRIARDAGLLHEIELICEPEAAALAFMHFGNRFSVCKNGPQVQVSSMFR